MCGELEKLLNAFRSLGYKFFKKPGRVKGDLIRYPTKEVNGNSCCPLNALCKGEFSNIEITKMADHLGIDLELATDVVRAADFDTEHLGYYGFERALTIRKELEKLC